MNTKILFLIGASSCLVLIAVYLFVLPPRVINAGYNQETKDIMIRFNKPVDRNLLQHSIFPEVHGQWKFQNPVIQNHLFKQLVFSPAQGFNSDIEYIIKLENITSPVGFKLLSDFEFNIKDFQDFSEIIESSNSQITMLDIPLDKQDNALSCEAASLKMALSFKNIDISEKEIMEKIGYDLTPKTKDLWGDPNMAYVGDINGKMCRTGYGVHWDPVAKAANNWRNALSFSNWSLQDIIEQIKLGNPVVIWGTLPTDTLTDCSWSTSNGESVKVFKETHVRLAIGFIGSSENPSQIIINDPLDERLYWPTEIEVDTHFCRF